MKNLLLKSKVFLLLLCCIIITTIELRAQTYYPLPTQNAYWTIYEWDENRLVYDDLVYTVNGDTILNNLQYTKVYKLNDHPTIFDTIRTLHCFMRQDNEAKKIWFIRHYLGETTEKLGYDFSVAIGDTVSLPAFDYGNTGDSIYIRSENPAGDSIEINDGTFRKHYFFHPISYSDNIIQFIEGVTNYTTTFPNKLFFFDPFHQSSTPCVKIDNLYLWPLGADEYWCGLNLVERIEVGKDYFQYFPNPASNYININIPSPTVNSILYLYNLIGKKLFEISLVPETNKYILNLSSFPSGIYLLELSTPTNTYFNKLIINH